MRFLLLLIYFLSSVSLYAQLWGRNTNGQFTNEAMDIEVDQNGNSYICGYITGETAFDITVVQPSAAGNGDIYIAKYSPSGALLWIKQYGGNGSDRALDLAIDNNGDIYVTGQFFGSVNFDGNTVTASGGSKDIFLIKMNSSGTTTWAISEGGSGEENAYGITTDNQNNLILTGQFQGNSTIGGQSFISTTDPVLNTPSHDIFISKYDTNGNPLWVQVGEAIYEDRGLAVSVDASNNIFMTGQFSDTLTFAGAQFNNYGYNVGFLAKFNPIGQLQWLNTLQAGMVVAYDLEVNNSDQVLITGDFVGTMQYTDANGITSISNPYYKKIFALKTDNNGNYMWDQTLGSDNEISARSISVDAVKDVYITGYFTCNLTELHVGQEHLYNSVGFRDIHLWKIDNNGTQEYVKQIGSKKQDQGHGVAVINNIQPIVCGSYTEDLNFPGSTMNTYSVSYADFDLTFGPSGIYGPFHYYLLGDGSRNSFLSTALNNNTPEYDFFNPQGVDSLDGYIFPGTDTIDICVYDSIWYEANTYLHYGPQYEYLWNTGDTNKIEFVSNTGTYTVEVERIDGCSNNIDTIFVIVHQQPQLPLMSDSLGLAVNEPGPIYYYYNFCAPDSVPIWFSDLDSNLSIQISTPGGVIINDTLTNYYSEEGWHNIVISDPYCTDTASFHIDLDFTPPHDVIPYMALVDNIDFNDSIQICEGDPIFIVILDSVTNPNGIYTQLANDPVVTYDWVSYPAISQMEDTFDLTAFPNATGWYTFTYFVTLGYDNLCGVDTTNYIVTDSFYVEISPLPQVNIFGDNQICPNGSIYLYIDTIVPGLSWYGPGPYSTTGINWVSTAGDSVQITEAGIYHYKGYLQDTNTNCSQLLDFTFEILEKQPPEIQGIPQDGIVCPNDSVYMWIDSVGFTSFMWTGPMGDSLSLTYELWDDDQGFYYADVVDVEGCNLTTAPFEIREYTSPYLSLDPSNVICDGESVDILAVFEGTGTINWINPPSGGNSIQITVNQGGWYVCEMQQCGITTLDSIQVIDGSFTANLTVSDTLLCYGETALISAPPGMSSYEWNTGEFGVQSILSSQDGSYYATLFNQYGCEAQTDTVSVDFIEASAPPIIPDTSICAGASLQLLNSNTTEWYTSDTTFISSSTSLLVSGIANDTSFLAAYSTPQCPLSFEEIFVTVIDPIPPYPINGSSSVCENDSITLSVNNNGETLAWYVDNQLAGSGNTLTVAGNELVNNNVVLLEISNSCFTEYIYDTIDINIPAVIDLVGDSSIVCYNQGLSLTLTNPMTTVVWTGSFGQVTGSTLNLSSGFDEGYIYVTGTDLNSCATNTDSIYVGTIDINPEIIDNISLSCADDEVELNPSAVFDSIQWITPLYTSTDTILNFFISDSSEGWYYMELWDQWGCNYLDSIFVEANPLPIIDLPNDTVICLRDFLSDPNFNDSLIYTWSGYGQMDSIIMTQDGMYYVIVENEFGCIYKDSILVDVVNCADELPNIFTPNGDGINDYFIIDEAELYPDNTLVIYNRWGNILYREEGYKNTYNGEGLNEGTYFFIFYQEGYDHPGRQFSGHVTLVRD